MDTFVSIISSAILLAAPLLYASVGEIFSERSSILNLGLEGIMLVGGVAGYIAAVQTSNLGLAILVTLLAGALIGLVYAFLTVTLQANQTVCGLAIVTFGTGLSGVLGKGYVSMKTQVSFRPVEIPFLSKIPVIGPILFDKDLMIYALYLLIPLSYYFIYKTRSGLKLRALGEDPAVLDVAGYNVVGLRYAYVIFGSAVTALGGAYITLAYTPSWINEITAGKGWIAAALVIFAAWNPVKAMWGALLFGAIEVIGLRLQVANVPVSSFFLSMMPYILTVAVLVLTSGSVARSRMYAAPRRLGLYYDREER